MRHRRVDPPQPASAAPQPVMGMLAGWGRLPVVLAQSLTERGYRVHCLGVRGHADGVQLARRCTEFAWVGLARAGSIVRFFRDRGVRELTMAGKIHKHRLFRPLAWLRLVPDWRTVRLFYSHFIVPRRDQQDDTLLRAVIEDFARDGLVFRPPTDYAPELLVPRGQLTRREPTAAERRDMAYGWRAAKQLGGLDIGQSVAVRNGAALAVEAVEGTDRAIERAGQLCTGGGFTVVKVAKPNQDMRFDVPTVGVGTLETMVRAGATALAVEADRTMIVDRPQFVRFANRHRLAVVALAGEPRTDDRADRVPGAVAGTPSTLE